MSVPGSSDRDDGERILHARDIVRAEDGPDIHRRGHLIGLIAHRRKEKTTLFWQLRDETGTVQVMVRQRDDANLYRESLDLHQGTRVEVWGTIGLSDSGIRTLMATQAHALEGVAPQEYLNVRMLTRVNTMAQVYLARLETHFAKALETEGYTRISTRLLSTDWGSEGLYPLKVLYDGYGEPFYISPSPVQQLVQGLVRSQYARLFTVSKCFTQTYRDPHVSVEALIVSGVALDTTLQEVLATCHEIALRLYDDASTIPLSARPGEAAVRRYSWPPDSAWAAVAEPEIQLFEGRGGEEQGLRRDIGRLCWPYRQDDLARQEYVIAEGFSDDYKEGSTVTCFTLNVERMLGLLLADTDLRRIPFLGSTSWP